MLDWKKTLNNVKERKIYKERNFLNINEIPKLDYKIYSSHIYTYSLNGQLVYLII